MSWSRRRSQKRLRTFDYSSPGPYWITIRLYHPRPLFGTVDTGNVHLSAIGAMIDHAWRDLPNRFPSLVLDAHVVMPDHIHGILTLFDGPEPIPGLSLGRVIGAFKGFTTYQYGKGVREQGWPPYERYFWLEDYYEHIIRDERDLMAKRLYVERNSWRWYVREHGPG